MTSSASTPFPLAPQDSPDLPPSPSADVPPFDPESFLSGLDLARRERIAIAVSGGGDSMALLAAADRLRRQGRVPELLALTVDHGLRTGSAAEARAVAAFCAARGIRHRILDWHSAKPSAGISDAARRARHELLASATREAGADVVLTGHTFEDQAETVIMRARRGGGRGEAGIAPATLYDGSVWFVRPLLSTRRAALRGFLRGEGIGWAEDPTNRDTHYERARIRLDAGEREMAAAVAQAHERAREREGSGQAAAALIDTHASRPLPGLIRLDMAFAAGVREPALLALRILLAVVGGRSHLVDASRARALFDRLIASSRLRASLSRCVVERRGGHLYLHRDARDLPRSALTTRPVDWDGRYRILALEQPGNPREIAAAGNAFELAGALDLPPRLARGASAAEPAVFSAGGMEMACESAPYVPMMGPWAAFLPSFDLAPAAAVARLVGAPDVPAAPFARHIRMA